MGNRENRFRILAVILSVLFFCAGIVLTLGIFLPITGLASSNYALFAVGQRIFSVYGFSSFLIPLLFLYGAVLLLIPGWSRESKAVLLGVPLYFVTAIIGERVIYTFVPPVSIPLIRQFVTVSILICALLLICFEIFLMLTLSEKLSGRRFSLRNIPVEDTGPENGEQNDDDADEIAETPASSAPAAEAADSAVEEATDLSGKNTSGSAASSEEGSPETTDPTESGAAGLSVPSEVAANETPIPPVNTAATAQEISEANAVSASSMDTTSDIQGEAAPSFEESQEHVETEYSGRNIPSYNTADIIKENTTDVPRQLPEHDAFIETGISSIADTQSEMLQSEQMLSVQPEHTIEPTYPEENLPLLEEVKEDEPSLPLSTPLSAIMNMQEEEAVRPVFDPSDPNNLFTSLEEITAPVERIKQTGTPEVQQESTSAVISPVKDEFDETDTPAATSVEEETVSMQPVENASVVADSSAVEPPQDEPEMPLVFVNGVPLPNGRSDLLDTMVVIDSAMPDTAGASEHPRTEAPVQTAAALGIGTAMAEIDTEEPDVDINIYAADIQAAAEADIGAEASIVPDENITEANVAADGFDIQQDGQDVESDEAEIEAIETEPDIDDPEIESSTSDVDDAFLETIEQAVPVIPAKPVSPPPPPRKKYAIPFDLLTNYPDGEYWIVDDATRRAALMLKSTFNEFKIDVSITGIRKGPVVTMFEMLPSPGIKLSKITNLQDNIALRLAASSVRIVAPIPGKHAVGIEVPNKKRSIVSFRELIETDLPEAAKMAIPVVLGKDVTGNPQVLDLAQTPHLLIAGATGSGKSVCVNSIILSILYNRRPDEVKLILVDPKIVELKLYNDIAHLLTPVITEPKRAFQALQYALCEMERRYALLDNMGVRDIKAFNAKIKSEHIATEALPYIVIIIDEFADLMATSGKELEATVARLCAMSRAVGIHLVLATQRPSIDVITGLIKANIPSRIAFMVASKTDSRIILDEMGAEKLLGKGDMLYVSAARPFPTRIQGAFVSEQEVERVVACVKEYCEPEYIDEEIFVDDDDEPYDNAVFSDDNDPLYEQALEIVTFAGKASASYVQRKLKIGYNRAARLIEEMEARGIVGPANGSKAREVIRHV